MSTAKQLMREFAPRVHDGAKHLIIGAPSEKYFAGIKLEKCAADGPDIDGEVVGQPENWK